MKIGVSSSRASGSTYFLVFSLRYVIATSAPSARNAAAQPQAIDCSFAMPTTSPLWPSCSLAVYDGYFGIIVLPFGWRSGSRTDERQRVARDHQFLIGRQHIDRDSAVRR